MSLQMKKMRERVTIQYLYQMKMIEIDIDEQKKNELEPKENIKLSDLDSSYWILSCNNNLRQELFFSLLDIRNTFFKVCFYNFIIFCYLLIRFFKVLSLNCVEYYHLYNNQFVIVIYLLQFSQILICQNGKLSQLYNNYELQFTIFLFYYIDSIYNSCSKIVKLQILHLDCQELCNLLPQHYFNQLLEASIIIILQMNKLSQIFFKICVLILFFVRVFCLNFIIDMIVDSFQQKMEAKS